MCKTVGIWQEPQSTKAKENSPTSRGWWLPISNQDCGEGYQDCGEG